MTLGNTLFPGALDTTTELPDVPPTAEQDDAGYEHDLVHKSAAQAVRALEAKVGADASAVATSLDALMRSHTHAGRVMGAKAYLTANQSINNATWTAVSLTTEVFDTDGFHDTVTNPSRFTVPAGKGGKYLVTGVVEFNASGTGRRIMGVGKNGSPNNLGEFEIAAVQTGGGTTKSPFAVAVDLSAGDYVEVSAYQSSGAALNLLANGESATHVELVALETRSVGAQGSGARAYTSASLNVLTATITALALNTERYDTDGYHDNVTNNSRFTVPKTGRYTLAASVTFGGNATGWRQVGWRINGATYIQNETLVPAVSSATSLRIQNVQTYQLNAGDYVEAWVWQDSTVTLGVTGEAWITAEETFATADPSSAGVKVTHNTTQSTPNAAEAVVALNAEIFDTDNYHDTVTNNSRITIPAGKAGRYLLVGEVSWAPNATGERYIYVRKNGGTKILGMQRVLANTFASAQTHLQAVAVDEAVAGDYYEVIVYQNSGGVLNLQTSSDYTPVFSATALNTQVPTAMNNWVGCVALTTAALSVPNSTNTNVPFEVEVEDTDAFHDTVTNNTRFTCPAGKAGRYRLTGQVRWSTNATGSREMYFVKNGVAQKGYSQVDGHATVSRFPQVTDTVRLNAGDYVELQVWQSSGGALTLVGSSLYNWASIEYLGP